MSYVSTTVHGVANMGLRQPEFTMQTAITESSELEGRSDRGPAALPNLTRKKAGDEAGRTSSTSGWGRPHAGSLWLLQTGGIQGQRDSAT